MLRGLGKEWEVMEAVGGKGQCKQVKTNAGAQGRGIRLPRAMQC